jgi:lambda family phage tail tape measure protein
MGKTGQELAIRLSVDAKNAIDMLGKTTAKVTGIGEGAADAATQINATMARVFAQIARDAELSAAKMSEVMSRSFAQVGQDSSTAAKHIGDSLGGVFNQAGTGAQGAATKIKNTLTREVGQVGVAAKKSVDQVSDSTDKLTQKVASMGHVGASLYALNVVFSALGVSIAGAARAADGWAVISAKMRIASGDAKNFAEIQSRLFDIAQDAGARFEDIGDVYAKVAKGGEQLGLTQERVIGVTQTVANTLKMMGGSSASASAALTQFGQALSSGELRGEELNSILEQMPPLAEAIAKGLDKPVGALRKLAADGKLSVEQLVFALEHSALEVERSAAKMPRTFSGSMAVLGNEVQRFVARINESVGASSLFNIAVTTLSDNMSAVAMMFGTVLAVAIGKATGAVIAATQAKIALAAATRAAAIEQARLAVQAAASQVAISGNTAALVAAQAALARLTGAAAVARSALALVGGPIGLITTLLGLGATAWMLWGDNAKSAADKARQGAEENAQAVRRILEEQRKGAKYGIGSEGALAERRETLSKSIAARKASITYRSGNRQQAPTFFAALDADENELREVNAGLKIELAKKAEYEKTLKGLATGGKSGKESKDELAQWIDDTAKAREAAFNRLAAITLARSDLDGQQKGEILAAQANKFFAPELAAQKDAEDQEKKSSDKLLAQRQGYIDSLKDLLGDAGEEVQGLLEGLKLDPSGQREAEDKRYVAALREKLEGIRAAIGDSAATEAMESAIAAIEKYRAASGQLKDAQEHIADAMSQRSTRLAEIQAMVASGAMTETEARNASIQAARDALPVVEEHIKQLETLAEQGYPNARGELARWRADLVELQGQTQDKGMFEGIQQGLKDVGGKFNDTFENSRKAVDKAFNSMTDALTDFVTTGKLSFGDLANSIIRDLIRIQVQESITKPLAGAMKSMDWSSLKFWADGGVPGGQSISAWRNQVVDQPTLFAFAKGAGVFGEAGPEAIMPLTRGPDGRLGVQASGGAGGVTVTQHITVDARGADAGVDQKIYLAMRRAKDEAVAAVAEQFRRGGPMARAVRSA